MPPRLVPRNGTSCCRASPVQSTSTGSLIAAFAGLNIQPQAAQVRYASILGRLSDNKGAVHNRKRVGRGPSSGHGKTSGRGHKGQGQHGKVKPWFQGGQTPLIVKLGKKGFDNLRAPKMAEVNLNKLQDWINQGRIDPTKPITPKELVESRLVGAPKEGIKLLARGSEFLQQPINIMVSKASASAIQAIEAQGGKIVTRYYTALSIKRLLSGESINTDKPLPIGKEHVEAVLAEKKSLGYKYRLPDPTSREDIEYYRDPAHRGYLSFQLKEGESPSLYFKVPGEKKIKAVVTEEKARKERVEELW
ncbi:hypothetical protein N3K66_007616 [Trichothecium roseum]|uniref:Uncharacterized protein n=1 Tax=Trichothecium roseum TaxID=47278 RepID=A0ACC0UUI2_9HYPO|nr:hypothetical protein N3K66_007616 [Trichothecium roseum]